MPALNEQKLIPFALASINASLQNSKNSVVTVVVDNGSDDATVEIAGAFGARIIREPVKGVGIARQTGLYALDKDVKLVLTTDSDTTVSKHWISSYQRVFSDASISGAYGPSVEKINGSMSIIEKLLFFAFVNAGNFVREYKRNRGIILALGNNSAFTKEDALEIGGYKRKFVSEDIDLMLRLRDAGGRIVYSKESLVFPSARRNVSKNISKLILDRLLFNIKTRFKSNIEYSGNENDNDREDVR